MATVSTQVDDLDGGPGPNPVDLYYKGTLYHLDLNDKNLAALEKAIGRYLDAAEKPVPATVTVGTGSSRPRSQAKASSQGSRREELDDVRAWLREHDHPVSDRGRIAGSLMELYRGAHPTKG